MQVRHSSHAKGSACGQIKDLAKNKAVSSKGAPSLPLIKYAC